MTPRIRVNVHVVTPGHVTVSLFTSDDGRNWGCVATGVTFGRAWWDGAFGAGLAVKGVRFEFTIGTVLDIHGAGDGG